MYKRWIENKDFRGSFLHKLDNFLKRNDLKLFIQQEDSHNKLRNVFEYWLYNSNIVPIDDKEIKAAEDFYTPWDAFDYFFEKNKSNDIYFEKGYNQLWLMTFK